MSGETTHPHVIRPTVFQSTIEIPIATHPNPTTAPTIECVVDTGNPKYDAVMSHVPAAISAAIIPKPRINAAYPSPYSAAG